MSIWLLMLIPLAASIGMVWLFRKKFVWWEYLSIYAISIVFIFVSKLIITTSMTSDTEYWSESGVKVQYEGAYDEWIKKKCSYRCMCYTDNDGHQHCQTCWRDCSYMKKHSAHYTLYNKGGKGYSISKSEYERIVDKWGNEKKTGKHSSAETYDDGIYQSYIPKNSNHLVECIVTSHDYENKVAVAHSDYEFLDIEITEDDISKYDLHDYPEINSNHKQKHILGPGDATKAEAIDNMNVLNAELGPKKQVKAFIIVFRGQSEEAGKMQEAYWKGGNKNEFVMTIGIDEENNVEWAYPFTWCENEILKTTTQNHVMQQDKLNLADISQYMYGEIDANFERKHFSDFSKLKTEPTKRSITITMIILFLITIGLVIGFALNSHDAKEREGGGIFKRFSKDNYDY